MREKPLAHDPETGLIHYDSGAKRTYVWPLCRTPYLALYRVHENRVVTCLGCLVSYVEYNWGVP